MPQCCKRDSLVSTKAKLTLQLEDSAALCQMHRECRVQQDVRCCIPSVLQLSDMAPAAACLQQHMCCHFHDPNSYTWQQLPVTLLWISCKLLTYLIS